MGDYYYVGLIKHAIMLNFIESFTFVKVYFVKKTIMISTQFGRLGLIAE